MAELPRALLGPLGPLGPLGLWAPGPLGPWASGAIGPLGSWALGPHGPPYLGAVRPFEIHVDSYFVRIRIKKVRERQGSKHLGI